MIYNTPVNINFEPSIDVRTILSNLYFNFSFLSI